MLNHYGSTVDSRPGYDDDDMLRDGRRVARRLKPTTIGMLSLATLLILSTFAMFGAYSNPAATSDGHELHVFKLANEETLKAADFLTKNDKLENREFNDLKKDQRDPKFSRNPHDKSYEWCFTCENRCDNIIKSLENNNFELPQEGKDEKYAALADSAPKFFRGTDHLYLEDVLHLFDKTKKNRPASALKFDEYLSDETRCFNDADQHIMNFGTFQDSREQIVYDLNDFDQTMIGHYAIDLFRLSTSVVMHSKLNGLSRADQKDIVKNLVESYVKGLRSYIGNDDENEFQLARDNTKGPLKELLMAVETDNVKYSRAHMLDKYTVLIKSGDENEKGEPILVRQLDLTRDDLQPVEKSKVDAIFKAWPSYVETIDVDRKFREDFYKIKHVVAKRVGAGVGSLGNDRFYILVEGNTLAQDDDYILDVKHEPEPEWYWHISEEERHSIMRGFESQGQRVANGFRAMNGRKADALLGFLEMKDGSGSYFVRQRSPWKAGIDQDLLTTTRQWMDMTEQWGLLLATNHARGDNDYDPYLIDYSFEEGFHKIYNKGFDELVIDFAFQYNNIVEEDYKCFAASDLNKKEAKESPKGDLPKSKEKMKEEMKDLKEEK